MGEPQTLVTRLQEKDAVRLARELYGLAAAARELSPSSPPRSTPTSPSKASRKSTPQPTREPASNPRPAPFRDAADGEEVSSC
jgi:hypothetical protein